MSRRLKSSLAPSILRAYDIRGIVDENFSEDDLYVIGKAFAAEMIARGLKRACVGYDGRLSSPMLEQALVDGLVSSGIDVLRSGLGPSPMLYYATYKLEADAGLMITGSHNPPEFNGLKMTLGGHAFFDEDIQRLGRRVIDQDFVDGAGHARHVNVFDDYVARIVSDYRGGKELRVAWDPGNGAAGDVTKALTERLPGTHFLINEKIDGTFPAHHPDPTVEKNLVQLKALVADNKCDLGIGFDGDGDRIGVIDAAGNVMWGDQLLVMLAGEVLADHPGAPILCDVKASRVFFDEIRKMGGEPVMWKAGHSHIKSKMAELNSPLAGEMSAHIFFKHRYYGYDDAIYTAIRLLSVIASSQHSFTEMLAALPVMHNTPEIRFDCDDARKFEAVDEITARARLLDGVEIFDMDGVRVETPYGWWLLRASNTQPMLVVRCESETAEGLERLKDDVRAQLSQSGIDASAI
ncbi:phosphomannomutase/phosphoglucomutase [Thalassospiraceae bacterium LMO-JJ14]|nr:phosphomannomutase/phosphoglucomutase [Thalassospiraceae bacterium LMO-JJ14]